MAFTINDLQDLTRLLHERPEWLGEVRRVVLTEELLSLPEIVRGLAEAQRRTEERIDQLAEAQRRTEERLNELVRTVERLVVSVHTLQNQMSEVRGKVLEMDYRDKAASYFGSWTRKPRAVSINELWDVLEERLSQDEMDRLTRLDLLIAGQMHPKWGSGDIWLAVEVSGVIDKHDIERAVERAGLLRKAGFRAVPVVAGHSMADEALAYEIAAQGVAALLNGSRIGWERALADTLQNTQS